MASKDLEVWFDLKTLDHCRGFVPGIAFPFSFMRKFIPCVRTGLKCSIAGTLCQEETRILPIAFQRSITSLSSARHFRGPTGDSTGNICSRPGNKTPTDALLRALNPRNESWPGDAWSDRKLIWCAFFTFFLSEAFHLCVDTCKGRSHTRGLEPAPLPLQVPAGLNAIPGPALRNPDGAPHEAGRVRQGVPRPYRAALCCSPQGALASTREV